jgi:hypothetical protein
MNTGVEILLKRMDSHPEEFQGVGKGVRLRVYGNDDDYDVSRRWDGLISAALNSTFLTDEEREALLNKLSSIQGEAFTTAVVEELTRDPSTEGDDWVGVAVSASSKSFKEALTTAVKKRHIHK